MKKLLFLCVVLSIAGLFAQTTVSQVSYVTTATLTESYDFSAVQSDGSLFLFSVGANAFTIGIHRTICYPNGTVSAPEVLMVYDSYDPFTHGTPTLFKAENKYDFTYLHVKDSINVYVFKIPDIAINTIPTIHVFANNGASYSYDPYSNYYGYELLGENSLYYVSHTDHNLYKVDLNTNIQTILISQADGSFSSFTLLGEDYIFVYNQWDNELSYIIDLQGNVTSPQMPEFFQIMQIRNTQPDIGGGKYLTWISDGLLRFGYYGYMQYANNQIDFIGLGGDDEGMQIPYKSHEFVVPLSNGRFISKETYHYQVPNPYFVTNQLSTYEFIEDTAFPNLHLDEYANPQRLFRMNGRYIIGVSAPDTIQTRFACIDFTRETIRPTTNTLPDTAPDDQYQVYYGAGKIYYKNSSTLLIYSIEDVVSNDDDTVLPIPLSVSVSPNPFPVATTISVRNSPATAPVVSIFNLKGQRITTLPPSQKSDSDLTFEWNGCDKSGASLPSGLYLYQVKADGKTLSGKVIKTR